MSGITRSRDQCEALDQIAAAIADRPLARFKNRGGAECLVGKDIVIAQESPDASDRLGGNFLLCGVDWGVASVVVVGSLDEVAKKLGFEVAP